jgi:hydrogenase nickel incorporation protein HypB
LLPYVEFDAERAEAHARQVNSDIVTLRLSALTGKGLSAWYSWLRQEIASAREGVVD